MNKSGFVWTKRIMAQFGRITPCMDKTLLTGTNILTDLGLKWTQPGVRGEHIYPYISFYITFSFRFFSWSSTSKMNQIYTKRNQRRFVTALLDGVTKIDGETIIETSNKARDYFAKGHLAPDANFVYEVLQDATYYFINVAPQVDFFISEISISKFSFNRSMGETGKPLSWM